MTCPAPFPRCLCASQVIPGKSGNPEGLNRTGCMSSLGNKPLNVGDKLDEKLDVALHLVCLEGVVAGIGITTPPGVTLDATMSYKL